ncbi:hypothetical protein EON63_08350 [archaeon]|nr:MAG: hypothetical protein EON63_08350 [archaeon]
MQSWVMSHDMTDPRILTDLVISLTTAENSELQRILELTGIEERLAAVLEVRNKPKQMYYHQPSIKLRTPYTIHYIPYTIHHIPYTIHHTSYTVDHPCWYGAAYG